MKSAASAHKRPGGQKIRGDVDGHTREREGHGRGGATEINIRKVCQKDREGEREGGKDREEGRRQGGGEGKERRRAGRPPAREQLSLR